MGGGCLGMQSKVQCIEGYKPSGSGCTLCGIGEYKDSIGNINLRHVQMGLLHSVQALLKFEYTF